MYLIEQYKRKKIMKENKQIDRQKEINREINRQTDRQTDRSIDRWRQRQINRERKGRGIIRRIQMPCDFISHKF